MPPRTDWKRCLQSGEIPPVVALVGNENILVTEAVETLRNKSLNKAGDFNRNEFRSGETPIQKIIDAARTLPMMASLRWVHLYDIQRLKAAELSILIDYLSNPSPTSILCLSGQKVDQRTKFGQTLAKKGWLFHLSAPKRGTMASWLHSRAKKHGFTIENDAAHLLVDLIGSEIGKLDMAVLKAGTFAGDQSIQLEHVEATVAATKVHTVFELTDAIGARDLPKASELLRNILGSGESGLMILAMITRQIRHLIQILELQSQGATQGEMASQLGIRPFVVDQLLKQSRCYCVAELRNVLHLTSRMDIRLKSSRIRHGVILDQFLLQIMESL